MHCMHGPPQNAHPAAQEAFYRVQQLSRQHMQALAALSRQSGMPAQGQGRCLMLLSRHPDCGQRDLAKLLQIEPATLSPLLKRMETAGLIHRVRDGKDTRMIRARLTPKGEAQTAHFHRVMHRYTDEVLSVFRPDDMAEFKRLLDLLQQGLEHAYQVCKENESSEVTP